ncbi:cyclic di-GMP phosphodiesterase response regulator RpfG [Clostridium ragsdalei P11]|uniref:Cyclic di-GMP phosphodiesterase response regulator RpfG n=1 Tax=Clostridium ragsdalei P11 TaxID=1353534 RepID=A0A1A6AYG1_9CLOT|nr:HD-GYP domain-containing protein [Clostridium ragsdalei]OBR95092.1 cyclic di-GMP phosphodiesterase response regulator RpfG [Clostridium ragsdalei P11]
MLLDNVLAFIYKNKYHDISESLVTALEAKDCYTCGHSARVAFMVCELAKKLGIKGKEFEAIHIAAHLHDIGKIGIPDEILNKKGKLMPHEWEYIKAHPKIGYDILSKLRKLKNVGKMVLCHHERWDGKGYPNGLSKFEIPLGSRMISVCDSIDAMTSTRPYRRALNFEKCMNEMYINKGIMFDPLIVDCVLDNNLQFRKIITSFKAKEY